MADQIVKLASYKAGNYEIEADIDVSSAQAWIEVDRQDKDGKSVELVRLEIDPLNAFDKDSLPVNLATRILQLVDQKAADWLTSAAASLGLNSVPSVQVITNPKS